MTQQAMKQLFCRISKVDEEKRTVTGIGASEAVDFEGEIFDYDSSKPYVEAWSSAAVARSQGKSYGNIRAMHQPVAAGKLAEPIVFDDAGKLVILTAYISDDAEWKKCFDGTYTGFSICGPIIGDKWADAGSPGLKRYTCAPIEFSVCDLPCNPEASFTAVKMGGVIEQRTFHPKEADVAKTKAAVANPAAPAVGAKSLYSIGDLADILGMIRYVQADSAYEAEYEGDGSPVPDNLKSWMAQGIEILVEMAREEGSEAVAAMKSAVLKFAPADAEPAVVKVKKTPQAKAQKALDSMGECMGKACKCQDIGKCMEKMAGAHQDACDAVGSMTTEDSDASKAAEAAAGAAPITTQAETPETGVDNMDEAQKAELALAAKNSAEALAIAKANQTANEGIQKALESILTIMSNEPVAAKSVSQAAHAVTKEGENGGAAPVVITDAHSAAKAAFQKPIVLGAREMHESGMNIGR
jgi:hypothetical protein